MARHVVLLGPVEHDGAIYEDGAELSVSGDFAAALVAACVLEPAQAAAKTGKVAEIDKATKSLS